MLRIFAAILMIVGSACRFDGREKDEGRRFPAAIPHDTVSDRATNPVQRKNLGFDEFRNLILRGQARSIEDALAVLNPAFSESLQFHTLVYSSLSIQEASFVRPRAIVFGPRADFVFTFNGDDRREGGRAFETMEYAPVDRAFQFREMIFKTEGYDLEATDLSRDEVAFENERVLISKKNPTKCLACHGGNASPIWANYFLWPGAYGSDDDQLGISFDKSSRNSNNEGFFAAHPGPSSQGRSMSFEEGRPDSELLGFVEFARQKPSHPRYKWLPSPPVESAVIHYANGTPFSEIDTAGAERARVPTDFHNKDWPTRPNLVFQSMLQKLNDDRLLNRLERLKLRGAYSSLSWADLENRRDTLTVEQMAKKILGVVAGYRFRHSKPSLVLVAENLRAALRDEVEMQIERVYRQDSALGPGSLRFQRQTVVTGRKTPSVRRQHVPSVRRADQNTRRGMEWIGDSRRFYRSLLNLKKISELEKIAFDIETDNQPINVAIAILLRDEGVDLHDFNTNLRQMSLAQHVNGIPRSMAYLGVPSPIKLDR